MKQCLVDLYIEKNKELDKVVKETITALKRKRVKSRHVKFYG